MTRIVVRTPPFRYTVTTDGFDRVTTSLALNSPGQPIYIFREEAMRLTLGFARKTAPVNNPLNATHRGGVVGTYRRALGVDRRGSNQFQLRFNLTNTADHAIIVNRGRRRSSRAETFGWSFHNPPGAIATHERGTAGRVGTNHLLRASSITVRSLAART